MRCASLLRLPVLTLLGLLLGCEIGDVAPPGGGGDDTTTPGGEDDGTLDCEPPFPPQDPAALPQCCTDFSGNAHCVDAALIPDEVKDHVAACDGGGLCIPDEFLRTGGLYELQSCSSIGNEPGVCLSDCIPQVQEYYGLLPDDTCALGQKCVPCINPLDGLPTGACELDLTCEGLQDPTGGGGGGDDTPPAPSCPYEGDPILDPGSFPACASCGGAHCVPNDLVPAEFASRLADCDAASKCVPDEFIATAGNTIPDSCESVAGAEGRCLSRCLPEVIEQQDLLPQSTCAATELCVPCFSPLDGAPTGACELSCDPGPTEAPVTFAACCEDRGKCVPAASIPDDQEGNLDEDDCDELSGEGFLCVPDQILADGPFPACTANGLFIGQYTGVCLSDCLSFGLQGIALARGNCPGDHTCAPCIDPLSGDPTGAPGCPP